MSTRSEPFSLLISLDATIFVLLSVFKSSRDDLPKYLFKIMVQECKKSTSSCCASLKNVAA